MRGFGLLLLIGCGPASLPVDMAPPPGDLTATAPALYPGHTGPVVVRGGLDSDDVHYALSLIGLGAGPCVPLLGGECLTLVQPTYLGRGTADALGSVFLPLSVPAGAPEGARVCLQTAALRGVGGVDSEVARGICSTVLAPDPCMTGETIVEIGTGEQTFTPLVPGQDFSMVRGAQNGWHLPLAVRVQQTFSDATLDISMHDVATGVSLGIFQPQQIFFPLEPVPGGSTCDGQLLDLYGFLDFGQLGNPGLDGWTAGCGREIRIDVVAREYASTGRGAPLGAASLTVILQPDPVDGPFCTP